MARSFSKVYTVSLTIALCLYAVPGGLAGPACARRSKNTDDCISKCSSKWGWPGKVMGTDPWGNVMAPADVQSADAAIQAACGVTSSSGAIASSPANSSSISVSQTTTIPSVPIVSASPSSASAISLSPVAAAGSSPSISLSKSSETALPSSKSIQTVKTSSSVSTQVHSTSSTPVVQAAPTTKLAPSSTSTKAPAELPATTSIHSSSPTPTSTKAAQAPAASSSSGSSGSTSASDINDYLSDHNTVRAQHGATPLTWSQDLANAAQEWASNCVFEHSGGTLGPYGENLAAGTGSSYDIAAAINSWAVEVSQYDPSNPQPSHFTQMVWKSTTQVGCAVALCNGIFPASYGEAQFYVCEYSPAGNVIGEFPENVQV